MTRLRITALIAAVAIGVIAAAPSVTTAPVQSGPSAITRPQLGQQITPLPEGAGKSIAEGACLTCHSSDLLRQQRLTRQQ